MARRFKVRNFGGSLDFTASTYNVDCGTDFVGVGDLTFSCWFKSAITASSNRRLFTNGKTYLIFDPVNKRLRVSSDGGTTNTATTNNSIIEGIWQHLVITRTSAGLVNHYINGVLSGAADQNSNTPVAASTNLFLGNTSNAIIGKMNSARFFNRILTVAEIQDIYYNGTVPSDSVTSMLAGYMLNEGAGTTANDTSGNSRHGTITGATFSDDVPAKTRKDLHRNLVNNGNFEFAPPFVAVGSTSNRWIDGTAGGSTTNKLSRWAQRSTFGTVGINFDTAEYKSGSKSLKVSLLGVNSFVEIANYRGAGNPTVADLPDLIPVLPSTSYTYSYWMKTNLVSGDSNHGACVFFSEIGATAGAAIVSTNGSYVKTTTGWTKYTGTFTTNASTRFLLINPRVYGHTGAASLIMDTWFDEIEVRPTTLLARTKVTSPRFRVRDFGTSVFLDGVNGSRVGLASVLSQIDLTKSFSFSCWVKPGKAYTGNIFTQYDTTINSVFAIGLQSTQIRARLRNISSTTDVGSASSGNVPIPVNSWSQIIYTWDTVSAKLYINNSLQVGVTANTLTSTNDHLAYIGARNNGQNVWNGNIDNLQIWSHVLTAQEITDLYLNGTYSRNGLFAEYLFDEGSGVTAYDSVSSNNGTLVAGASYSTDVRSKNRTSNS